MEKTKTDVLFEVLGQQAECNCGRGYKVAYYCHVETCPNHQTQPQYCIMCNNDDDRHDHKPKEIIVQGDMVKGKWQKLM